MSMNIRTAACLALALLAVPAGAGQFVVRDNDRRVVETIEKGIGDRLTHVIPMGACACEERSELRSQ